MSKNAVKLGFITLLIVFFASKNPFADIVINEIMYHPLSDETADEYIELYNNGEESVDLKNYAFTQGIAYTFQQSTVVAAHGYLVVAGDAERIKTVYGIDNVTGNYVGKLSNAEETITLEDNQGRIVDEVAYADTAPWPEAADGDGPSLELISPDQDNNDPSSWRVNDIDAFGHWGTPGHPADYVPADLPPPITNIRHRPENPGIGDEIFIRADVEDDDSVQKVWAEYTIVRMNNQLIELPVPELVWNTLNLFDDGTGGDRTAGDGSYETSLPFDLPAGTMVRYRIYATDLTGNQSTSPSANSAPSYYSLYIMGEELTSKLAVYSLLVDTNDLAMLRAYSYAIPPDSDFNATVTGSFVDNQGRAYGEVQIRFDGSIEERRYAKPGWKIFFNDGDIFGGVEELNLNALAYIDAPAKRGAAGLYESIAWQVFRLAGVPSPNTRAVKLLVNGENQGVYLQREDIEEDFLERLGRDRDSNLYHSEGDPGRYPETRGDESLLSSLEDYQKTYDNVTNRNASYDDLIQFITDLNKKQGDNLKAFFEQSLDVDYFVSYLAAGTLCADIDRVWHNHFLYHDAGSDRWEVIPDRLSRTFEIADASLYLDAAGYPTINGPWPLVTQFLSIPEFRVKYEDRVRELLIGVFHDAPLDPTIAGYIETVREEAEADRQLWEVVMGPFRDLNEHWQDLKSFIYERQTSLISQLPETVLVSYRGMFPVVPKSSLPIVIDMNVLTDRSISSMYIRYDAGGKAGQKLVTPAGPPTYYSATLDPQPDGTVVKFYLSGTLDTGETFRYPEEENQVIQVKVTDDPLADELAVVINEIAYNGDVADNEWIELYNPGAFPVDASDWVFKDGNDAHAFTIPSGTKIPADGYLVLAFDSMLVTQIYSVLNVVGDVEFNLSNGGDTVRVFNSHGQLIDAVIYDDAPPWPIEPDGEGPSLELISFEPDNSWTSAWMASDKILAPRGTPGRRNSVTAPPVSVSGWMLY